MRHYDRVQTTAPSRKSGARMGRPPIRAEIALSCVVRISLKKSEYDALLAFAAKNFHKGESAAGRAVLVPALRAAGFLKDPAP